MKKNFLLAATVLLSTAVFAQTKPFLAVRAGVSYAGLKGDAVNTLQNVLDFADGAFTTSRKPGVFGGVAVNLPVSENFSIEPGLFYTQKGYELRGELALKNAEFLSANARAQLNTAYIDLPVLAKGTFNGFQVFAGPQVSYLADAKLRTRAGALGFTVVDNTANVKRQFNSWDVAVTGGVGYQLPNGFSVNASYDHGLSRIDNGQNFDARNRVVKLGIGLRF